MGELVEALMSWRLGLLVVLVFGVLPGPVMRLVVRAYPKDDPRRREYVAEVYAVPPWERPIWIGQQLQAAIFEGPKARHARRAGARERTLSLFEPRPLPRLHYSAMTPSQMLRFAAERGYEISFSEDGRHALLVEQKQPRRLRMVTLKDENGSI